MGLGIWSMHYIGMLAFTLPVPVRYDLPTVLLSLVAAIFASGVALFMVSGERLSAPGALAGSAVMGSGIAAMHYVSMAAMRLPAMCHWNWPIVTLSVAIAIAVSLVALWLTFRLRTETREISPVKIASAAASTCLLCCCRSSPRSSRPASRCGRAATPTLVTRHSIREAQRRLRVLLAEDNSVNQLVAVKMLGRFGHSVVIAGNGREALAGLAAGRST